MEVNAKTGGTQEDVQQFSQAADLRPVCVEDQQRVIGVLDDGAREVVHKRVKEAVLTRVAIHQAWEEVCDQQEYVGGQGPPPAEARSCNGSSAQEPY